METDWAGTHIYSAPVLRPTDVGAVQVAVRDAAHSRDSLAVHFTWRKTDEARHTALPLVEHALRKFGARPHWGKAHHLRADELAGAVPRLAEAQALFDRWDPRGVFSSPGLVELGVRAS